MKGSYFLSIIFPRRGVGQGNSLKATVAIHFFGKPESQGLYYRARCELRLSVLERGMKTQVSVSANYI